MLLRSNSTLVHSGIQTERFDEHFHFKGFERCKRGKWKCEHWRGYNRQSKIAYPIFSRDENREVRQAKAFLETNIKKKMLLRALAGLFLINEVIMPQKSNSEKIKMTKTNLIKSFLFAINGISHGISKERNIKIQTLIGLSIIFLSIILRIPKIEFIIILIISFLVIILELLNTCFEKLIDLINPDYHIEFGKIKDITAGIVLLGVILSILAGFLILYNPLVDFIKINFSFFFIINIFLTMGIAIIIYLIIIYSQTPTPKTFKYLFILY